MKRGFALYLLISILTAALPVSAVERTVAIGDVHGAYDEFVEILTAAGLIDEHLDWVGGQTVLVQTGDLLDRGTGLKEVVGLLQKLQVQAEARGGRVIPLLGNHEAMNLLRITRDVSPDAYAEFADSRSEERRREAWKDFSRWKRQRAKRLKEPRPTLGAAEEQAWMDAHPPGYLEYLDAMGPRGEIGRWLRTLRGTVKVGDGVFLHGGITPAMTTMTESQVNQRLWDEVSHFDGCREELIRDGVIHETSTTLEMADQGMKEVQALVERLNQRLPEPLAEQLRESVRVLEECVDYQDWYLVSPDGPLWYREFAKWTPEEGTPLLDRMLESRGARFFAVGHTVQKPPRIEPRFDSRVFLIDTGMLTSVYNGRASALEIEGGEFTAIYVDGRQPLPAPPGIEALPADSKEKPTRRYLGPGGETLPFLSDDEVLGFLQTAEIVGQEGIPTGITKPLKFELDKDRLKAYAVFRHLEREKDVHRTESGRIVQRFRDSFRYEVAAYRLSRLLGIDQVPPAVLRRYQGEPGSLQLWVENAMTEEMRREADLQPPEPVYWSRQIVLMRFFDALIQNLDRNQGNVLVDKDTYQIWLIDHSRSFPMVEEIPDLERVVKLDREVWQRFRSLTEDEIRAALGDSLTDHELSFLMRRWRTIRDHVEGLIAEQGEEIVLFDLGEYGYPGEAR